MSTEPKSNVSQESSSQDSSQPSQKILIGSQRNPDAFHQKPTIPAVDPNGVAQPSDVTESVPQSKPRSFDKSSFEEKPDRRPDRGGQGFRKGGPRSNASQIDMDDPDYFQDEDDLDENGFPSSSSFKNAPVRPVNRVPVPNIHAKLSDDLEEEFASLFEGKEMESLMAGVDEIASQAPLEPETKLKGKIISISSEDVFMDIGGRDQGIVPLKQFKELPEKGQIWDVIVMKYLPEEGLYDLTLPLAAADVREWEQVQEGMILTAKITAANTGGLECEVNKLRGFIPMGQIALYRVEKPEEFVGEMLTCVVMEVNPMRRNLILSRKVMLEREREELRQKLLDELEVGQVREGLVRKLIDAGAFVDLGGVDGFIPISALSWGRVKHPSEVLSEGSRIKVKVVKIDPDTNRISLAYRDDADNPWANIFERFQEKTNARGKVSKIMDFGAFVELMPGVEGLVHISELSHNRVAKVSDVLNEGEWIDVFIQSIDPSSKRIALSIKQLTSDPKIEAVAATEGEEKKEQTPEELEKAKRLESHGKPIKSKNQHKGPLRGGTETGSGGDKFGLKW